MTTWKGPLTLCHCARLAAMLALLPPRLAGQDTLLIADVSVIPMDRQVVLEHQSVVIAGGRIVRIGATGAIGAPRGAQRIDGRGRFLLPGLADMHVHLSTGAEFPMYVGNGVLTVRDLNGSPTTLEWRRATGSGAVLGPRIFTSGPMIAGGDIPWRNKVIPKDAAEAEAAVMAQKAAGYDQVKIYDGLSKEVFDAAIATARRVGMPTSGHIPAAAGFEAVLASGMTGLEHLDKTVFATVQHDLDTLRIPGIVERIRRSGMWVVPTLSSMIQLSKIAGGRFDSLLARPEALAAPAELRDFWTSVSKRLAGNRPAQPGSKYNPWCDYQIRLAGALAKAGVPMMAGTDLPNAVLVPGYSLHDELDALVEAGLSRFEALVAATSAPARFFGQQDEWGTVAVGRAANLVLVDRNPLDDLAALRTPAGVVLAGRWLDRERLATMRGAQ